MNATVQKLHKAIDDLRPDAGKPFRQGIRAQQQRSAHVCRLERLTHTAGVAAQDIELQVLDLLGPDANVAKFAETGGNAVDDGIRLEGPVDYGSTARNALPGFCGKDHSLEIASDALYRFQCQRLTINSHRTQKTSKLRISEFGLR